MKIKPSQLQARGYVSFENVKHNDLISFLNEKNKERKSFFSYTFLIILLFPIGLISYSFTKGVVSGEIEFLKSLLFCLSGVVLVFLFIPFHELLHGLAYKIIGARNISYFANWRKFYFAAISDQSVINVQEFRVVALFPFLFVIIAALISIPMVNDYWALLILCFAAVHNLFSSGDFALLNYMEIHKEKGIVTYDDKLKGETYFYVKSPT